jgi:hypothetical protein
MPSVCDSGRPEAAGREATRLCIVDVDEFDLCLLISTQN